MSAGKADSLAGMTERKAKATVKTKAGFFAPLRMTKLGGTADRLRE
jgi:hypothetical protein